MSTNAAAAAEHFLKNETQFHLGFLPTEQSHPLTKGLDKAFERSTAEGFRLLQKADREVLEMAQRVLKSDVFAKMVEAGRQTIAGKGRMVFSGCGATGRLSILLESMWREFFKDENAERAASIMTGGDYALVKAVEFFEDYQVFGRKQVAELNMGKGDMLIAITEGGETSSVIGTVKEAAERGCAVFLLFNNPADLLRKTLVRCREVIDDPRVTVLDLCCGPMGIAGSTRMQATSSEQLVAGAFLEILAADITGTTVPDFAVEFEKLLDHLESDEVVNAVAEALDFEVATYKKGAKITYFAADYLLDIFTDTTERTPTFMLPPFKNSDDKVSPPSWAFVKDPRFNTRDTWANMLHRAPRCLNWTREDYIAMESEEKIINNPPKIDAAELYRMEVGCEPAPERCASANDVAICIKVAGAEHNTELDKAFAEVSKPFAVKRELVITSNVADTNLHLMNHMAIKLVLNNYSSGTMVCMGRVSGNWMSWVNISNKKLVDRAIRLIAELGNLEYADACLALFESVEEMEKIDWTGKEKPSVVQYTLKRLS